MKRAGKLDDARAYYNNAIDLEPDNSIYMYNTGVLHNIRSDYGLAVDMLERSIEHNKRNVYAYLQLGDALERQKKIKKLKTERDADMIIIRDGIIKINDKLTSHVLEQEKRANEIE